MKKEKIFLIGLFLIAFFLRFYFIPQNLFFGPEQGIDFGVVKNIVVNHKLTLIGAKTDINGIFHGPIYYYLSVIPFLLSGGSPIFISAFFIFLNSLSVFLIYILGNELFNKRVALISAILFTVSFGAIVYSRWLSSHPLSIPLSCLFFIFLNRFLKKGEKKNLIFTVLMFGLIAQSEFLNLIFFSVIAVFIIIIFNKKFRTQNKAFLALCTALLFLSSIGNFIFFDLRHQFIITKNVLLLISGSGYYVSFVNSLKLSVFSFSSSFSSFVLPFLNLIAFLLALAAIFYILNLKKTGNKNVLLIPIWLISPVITLVLLHHDVLEQFFVSSTVAAVIIVSVLIDGVWKKSKYLGFIFLTFFIIVNFRAWAVSIPQNRNIFFQSTQPELKFSDQKKVIDKIYQSANGKPFSFQAYTIPYWSQQAWEFLFWQYGRQKYGYDPIPEKSKTLFVIIQDDLSNEKFQKNWIEQTVNKWGKKTDSSRYGSLEVQKLMIENGIF